MTDPAYADQTALIDSYERPADRRPRRRGPDWSPSPRSSRLACSVSSRRPARRHLDQRPTYLHSWGSIFIQDVVLPFQRNRFPARAPRPAQVLDTGVAVFAFVFSLL